MRFIHAVREVNAEHGLGLQALALYTDPDRGAMFVREADESFALGPATFTDGADRKSTYLNYELMEQTLRKAGAEAVWAGWGFVAEHAEFVAMCDRMGVQFIGPSADVMRRLGDKITSKRLAEEAGVPVAPWSGGAVETLDDALATAEQLGYPLMLKATAGGGGRGIRRLDGPEGLSEAFESARSEALSAFGDGTLFLEKRVSGARHIEVQIIGDEHGTVWAVGVRDCSVQRRNQKIIEEAPSPVLTAEQDQYIKDAARRLGEAAGYVNAGTVEFLYSPDDQAFWFMEVNARLQVEHPITEATTGVDMVKLQLHVAGGGALEGDAPVTRGHAVEVRLNAEDPENSLAPSPGEVEIFRPAGGPGVRVDTGIEEDDEIAAEFDSMVAKIISYGRTRSEAIARLDRALRETALVIRGGASNKAFLRQLLTAPEVLDGSADVGWLDRTLSAQVPTGRHGQIALLQAAIESYLIDEEIQRNRFASAAARGRPDVAGHSSFSTELTLRGNTYECAVARTSPTTFRVGVDGAAVDLTIDKLGKTERRMQIGPDVYRLMTVIEDDSVLVDVNGEAHRVRRDLGGEVRSPSPAVVVSLAVEAGDFVTAGERLAVLEAMKMEMTVAAPYDGRVRTVLVSANTQVALGVPLLILEREEAESDVGSSDRMSFADLEARAGAGVLHNRCTHHLAQMESIILGYDVDLDQFERSVQSEGLLCEDALTDEAVWEREAQLLTMFVDIASLFRPERAGDQTVEDARRTNRDYFFDYLRDPGARGEGLPASFVQRLERALAHYGIASLAPKRRLRRALYRIYISYRRLRSRPSPIMTMLQGWREAEDLSAFAAEYRPLLNRIVDQTRRRFREVHDLASEVIFEAFDHPVLEERRMEVYAEADAHLEALAAGVPADERDQRMQALVMCPEPLKATLSGRFPGSDEAMRRVLLEVMARRYYRMRALGELVHHEAGDTHFLVGEYPHEGSNITLIISHVLHGELTEAVSDAAGLITELDPDNDVVVDFYGWREERVDDPALTAQEFADVLDDAGFDRPLRRVVLAVTSAGGGVGMSNVEQYTYRPSPAGFQEEPEIRGLHPMMAKRLEVWRLSNFDLERQDSGDDVYLFRGVARENPRDVRLFALAEVRDLAATRDDEGRLLGLPTLERVFAEACAAIRHFQAALHPQRRLVWNRILLYVWPIIDLQPDEMAMVVSRLAPATEGLGIEKVVVRSHVTSDGDQPASPEFEILNPADTGVTIRVREPRNEPLQPLDPYTQKVVRLRSRGITYPYELIKMITPAGGDTAGFPRGSFVEYELADGDALVPVDRPPGENPSNIIVGEITNYTTKYPEGMRRVLIAGDPTRGMGNLAEAECRRINAALAWAGREGLPVEWYAISAGALISMDSGTENMDWIALVLRRIIEFTQDGGELNVVVTGINVGAQPYWNAEATMLMHTKGILVMTPDSAMVLTGKQALDYSGGVSAEDNQGIGGYEQIMGPNGQGQYFAPDLAGACRILLSHYDHSYVIPGERFPRRAMSIDPAERDVRAHRHGGRFATVGDVFDDAANPGRKFPFEIRRVMEAVVDVDAEPLERWFGWVDAEVAVVWDAHLGGIPVSMIGFESKPLPRFGAVPADGPGSWTAGTLFPQSSRKIARAINAASGSRPLVVLANLSGFDGSPESLRKWQLEYGAEIGRAIVNFDGPIVFCVVSRYHGGAFVVFSNKLNDHLEVAAVEGARASVIGGAPAAAVVFAREVRRRTDEDDRVAKLASQMADADGAERLKLRGQLDRVRAQVHSEHLGAVADEFDTVHSVHRAKEVGSVHEIISAAGLRPYLIDAVERGMAKFESQ